MAVRLTSTALSAIVLLTTARMPGWAQSRAAGAVGVLAFEGTRGESGVGLMGAAQFIVSSAATRRFAVEFGVQTLRPFGQVCTLGVPSECHPASPASPVWHARVLISARVARTPFYLPIGLGAYGPVGRAGQSAPLALGLDTGIGLRLSPHAAIEARYLHLRTTRFVGWAVPISLVVAW